MTHLFLFSIGPVQGFIAQARKTRDLAAGSAILTEIMRAACQAFESQGGKVIFPADWQTAQSLTHRMLGSVTGNGHLRDIGAAVAKVANETWGEIAGKSLGNLNKPIGFDEQIAQHLETYWVFTPCTDNYSQDYKRLERSLGAVKNARPVQQYAYQGQLGETGRKCSLDGVRNVKFYRKSEKDKEPFPRKLFQQQGEVTLLDKKSGLGLLPNGEGLSAVSFVKREYGMKKLAQIVSTADIAAMEFENQIQDSHLADKYKIFKACFVNSWDGQLLFAENYTDSYWAEQDIEDTCRFGSPAVALDHLQELYREAKNLKPPIKKPHSYYALLLFDGDSMGKWISGEHLADPSQIEAFHGELSQKLATFAKWAYEHVGSPKGQAIYAGGDDFLGFVNLEHLIPVLQELREEFAKRVNAKLSTEFQFKPGKELTFTAGVVIAHYKNPLHAVLEKARAAEKAAKRRYEEEGKNGFCFSVMKKSGEEELAFGRFEPQTLHQWQQVIDALREDFSDKFLRVIHDEFSSLLDWRHPEKGLDIEIGIIESEIKRLIGRACSKHGKEKEEKVKDFYEVLIKLLRQGKTDTDDILENLSNFMDSLFVCDFIERHTHGLSENQQ